jgi:hypothetical protein
MPAAIFLAPSLVMSQRAQKSDPALEMVALIVCQCDGDRVFVLANKLIVVATDLMGKGLSCAPNRDAFTIPQDIDCLGSNAVKLREFSVDVGLIHFQVTACGRGYCCPTYRHDYWMQRPMTLLPLGQLRGGSDRARRRFGTRNASPHLSLPARTALSNA